jgi:hypothetical protein
LIAGCGSSGGAETSSSEAKSTSASSPPTHAAHAWTGYGATIADFESAHPKNSTACAEGCYGQAVEVAPNETGAEFHGVNVNGGRVTHYEQDLGGSELAPAAAEQTALAMLPRDAHVVRSEVSHENGSCKILVVRSNTLARWFADPAIGNTSGLVEVDLHGVDPESGQSTYPAHLSEAAVGLSTGAPGC